MGNIISIRFKFTGGRLSSAIISLVYCASRGTLYIGKKFLIMGVLRN